MLERVDEPHAFDDCAVMRVFGKQDGDASFLCGRPQHRVPEGQLMIPNACDGVSKSLRTRQHHRENRLQFLNALRSLCNRQIALASCDVKELRKGV